MSCWHISVTKAGLVGWLQATIRKWYIVLVCFFCWWDWELWCIGFRMPLWFCIEFILVTLWSLAGQYLEPIINFPQNTVVRYLLDCCSLLIKVLLQCGWTGKSRIYISNDEGHYIFPSQDCGDLEGESEVGNVGWWILGRKPGSLLPASFLVVHSLGGAEVNNCCGFSAHCSYFGLVAEATNV